MIAASLFGVVSASREVDPASLQSTHQSPFVPSIARHMADVLPIFSKVIGAASCS